MTEAAFDYGDLLDEAAHPWRTRLIWLALLGAIVAAVATGVWWEFLRGSGAATAAQQTATVDRGTVAKTVSTSGVVSAQHTSSLSFPQSGKVTAVNVTLGQKVTQGDVLATIDATDLQAALDTANMNLATAQLKLTTLLQGSTASQLAAADQSVIQAQASYDKAVRALNTLQQPPTPTDLAAAQQGIVTAQAQLGQAQQARAKVDQMSQDAITAAQATVNKSESALTSAENSASSADAAAASAQASLFSAESSYCPDATISFCSGHTAPISSSDQSKLASVVDSGPPAQATLAAKVLSANTAYGKSLNDQQAAHAAVTSAQNDLSTAQTALSKAQQGPTSADIASADSAISAAQVAVDTAQSKLATLQAGPTQDQLASAQSDISTAAASLTAAQAKRDETYAGSLPSDIQQQRQAVAQAQTSVDTATKNLDNAKLIAPFDGTVAAVNIQVGDTSGAGGSSTGSSSSSSGTAIILNTPDAVRIDLTVSETDLPNVKVGQAGTATFDAITGRIFPIVIDAIGTNPTTTQGVVTYAVRAHLAPFSVLGGGGPGGGASNNGGGGAPPVAGTVTSATPPSVGATSATPTTGSGANGTPGTGRGGRNGGGGGAASAAAASTATPVPGMNARITIIVDQRQNVLRLPVAAVTQSGRNGSTVQVKQADGTTQSVQVTTGLSDGQRLEITSGVDEGATVVLPAATTASTGAAAVTTTRAGGGGGFGGFGGGGGGGGGGGRAGGG